MPEREWRRLVELFGPDRLAELLGTSASSVRRYSGRARSTPDDIAGRLHFLALTVGDLAGAYNEVGIRRWFERQRSQLDSARHRICCGTTGIPPAPDPGTFVSWLVPSPSLRRRDRLPPRRPSLAVSLGGRRAAGRALACRRRGTGAVLFRYAGWGMGRVPPPRRDPDCGRPRDRHARDVGGCLVAPSAALLPGEARGCRVDGGLHPARTRDGNAIVLFGPQPGLVGWAAAIAGRPGKDLLAKVRYFGVTP